MVKALKKILLSLMPERQAGLHLPVKGRVVAIGDPVTGSDGALADDFRPYFAVDVQLLKADGSDDTKQPIMEALPLPVSGAGEEGGFFQFPAVGSIVVISFAYGSQAHPFISAILPNGSTIPPTNPGDSLLAQSPDSFLKIDREGNHTRQTNASIIDDGHQITQKADIFVQDFGTVTQKVDGDDLEEIGGSKKIETMGTLDLTSGAALNLTALENSGLNFTQGLALFVGMDYQATMGSGALITLLLGDYEIKAQVGGVKFGNLLANMEILADGSFAISNTVGAELSADLTGILAIKNNGANLKAILEGIIDEVMLIIVTMGTGPNVAALTILKTQIALLLK